MLDLLKQKEILLTQLSYYADTLGYTHPQTVATSQELDLIVNETMHSFSIENEYGCLQQRFS